MTKAKLYLLASAALFMAPLAAQAEEAGTAAAAPAPEAAADVNSVQQIVITATRRAVDLQRVASTVEAVPAATLNTMKITNVLQLTDVIPGLVVAPSGGNNLYIRGVGVTSGGYNEAQVAVYIDGLYLPNPAMGIYSFNNIDQVEVLKGPQGTLYGRNATAGLIAITTRDPGESRRVDASLGYGNYGTWTQNFYGSTPLSDNLAANVAIYHSQQAKGWGVNPFNGREIDKSKETGIQAKFLWRPGPNTKITTNFIYDNNDRDTGLNWIVVPGTIAADGTTYTGKYRAYSRVVPRAPFNAYIASVKVQQDLQFATLTSTTGYQSSQQHVITNANTAQLGQPVAGQFTTILELNDSSKTWSQEFQLASKPSSSRLDWVAGLYYYNDRTRIAGGNTTTCVGSTCAPGSPPPINTVGYPTTVSYSGYADATYRLADSTRITLGGRYTDETKGLTGYAYAIQGYPNSAPALPATAVTRPGQPYPGNPAGIPPTLHFSKFTYRIVLSQDFGPNIHAYISDNLGFKSGAFNATSFANPPVRPEILDAYEAGVKSELFDRRLRLNLSYFYYDYKDVQVRSTAPPAVPGTSILSNVASERVQGVDADFSFVPVKGLTINGGFEYLDAKYKRFPGTSCATPGPTRVVNGVTVGSVVSVPCALDGYKVALAVPFSGTLGFLYNAETSYGSVAIAGNYHYDQRHVLTSDASVYAPAAHVFDASLTWTSPNRHFDVQLYGKNLTNEYRWVNAFVAANSFAYLPGAPRTYGLTVGYHY